MTITDRGATKALFVLDACNLNAAKQGQAAVWAEVIRDARPTATDDDLLGAVKRIATQRNADAKGGTWVTPGDVIAEMRKARNHAIDTGRAPAIDGPAADPERVRELISSVASQKALQATKAASSKEEA